MNGVGDWRPRDYPGVWRYGPAWARPFVAAAPWVMFGLALGMLLLANGSLTLSDGADFELPAVPLRARDVTGPVAVLMPGSVVAETGEEGPVTVFFDDARYVLSDGDAARRLRAAFAGRNGGALVLLADRRVPSGDLMRVVSLARKAGVKDVRVAGNPD